MEPFQQYLDEYRRQLEKGAVKEAYRGLIRYMMDLRTYFESEYPGYFVSGSIYTGYMDMSYFSFSPGSLKDRKLKVALVFLHEAFRFEAWLAGVNKQVQSRYWKLFRESGWNKYNVVSSTKGADSIIEGILVDKPDFTDLDALTKQIERATLRFIKDVESFLDKHDK